MGDELSKNDLFILMESYKNNVQLNTTLLEQQKQIMIMNGQTIERQQALCKSVDDLVEKLTTCSKILSENHIKISNDLSTISTKICTNMNELGNSLENTICEETGKLNKCCTELSNKVEINTTHLSHEHSKITNKIYLAFIGMSGIIVSIITLSISFADKYHTLSTVIKSHIGG